MKIAFILVLGIFLLGPVASGQKPDGPVQDRDPGPPIEEIGAAAFSPDSKFLLAGLKPTDLSLVERPLGRALFLWETSTGKLVKRFPGHPGGVLFVAFFPDGKNAISGGKDGIFRIWDISNGKEVRSFQGFDRMKMTGILPPASISRDSKELFAFGFDRTGWYRLKVWEPWSGKLISMIGKEKHNRFVRSITLSPNGKMALLECSPWSEKGKDYFEGLLLWDVSKGRILHPFSANLTKGIFGGAFSPDNKKIVASERDFETKKTVFGFWDVASKKKVGALRGSYSWAAAFIDFTPDGKNVAIVNTGGPINEIVLHEVATGDKIWQATPKNERITAFAMAPNSKLAFTASGKHGFGRGKTGQIDRLHLEIWDLSNGRRIRELDDPPKYK